jgi:effector-binding domain-containing protein
MPLERIAKVLDAPEADRAVEIRRYWIELEGSMAVRLRLVEYLNSFLEGRGDTMYEVRTRHIPEQQVLTVKRSVRQPELLPFLMEAMPGVAVALDKTGVHHATRTFVIYHGAVNADSDGPVEVCMAFDGTIQAPDGFAVRTEPAHEEAYVTISKRQMEFPKILDAYDAVSGYVNEHGEMAGAPREVYFVDVNAVGPDDPFADVAKPMTAVRQPAAS